MSVGDGEKNVTRISSRKWCTWRDMSVFTLMIDLSSDEASVVRL